MKTPLTLALVFVFATSFFQIVQAQCTAAGTYAGTGTNNASGGSIAWSNPGNAAGLTADGTYATASGAALTLFSSANSNDLVIENLGFNVPSGNVVCGIAVTVTRMATGIALGYIQDNDVRMLVAGVPVTGTGANHALGGAWPVFSTPVTYGGMGDTWGGGSWTPAMVNDPGFGVKISANLVSILGLGFSGNIDNVTVTVYSEPGVLAMPLQDFSAQADNGGDLLQWTAAGSDGEVAIERSGDGSSWIALEEMGLVNHSYTDAAPLNGDNYYRLLLKIPGRADAYSPVQVVHRDAAATARCFPNPFVDAITITSPKPFHTVVLRNFYGSVLLQKSAAASYSLQLPAGSLPSGVYFVQVDDAIIKMVKGD